MQLPEPALVMRATLEDHAAGVATLVSSFADNPFFLWLVAHPDDMERRLRFLYSAMLKVELSRPAHIVDVVDGGAGIAIWHDVDKWRPTAAESARLLQPAIRTYGKRLGQAIRVQGQVAAAHPACHHRHLAYIGVERSRQGSGLGSRLLADAVERCDQDGVAAYLENLNPFNTPLYQRFGFTELGPIPLPAGAPPITAMWRAPAGETDS